MAHYDALELQIIDQDRPEYIRPDEGASVDDELVHFLRSQYGSRFIENKDASLPEQSFQQFHALLLADGKLVDRCARINCQTEFFGETTNSFLRSA